MTSPLLMKAILSMDAYNRGYDASITLPDSDTVGTQVGSATIVKNKGDGGWQYR